MSQLRVPHAALVAVGALLLLSGVGVARAASPEWNIARIGAPRSAAGVVVAVVDTGVDPAHPVFGDRVLPEIDLVGDGQDGDPHGHGTHVAGTVAGADNGCGSIGVAPDARILPVRVLNEAGKGTSDVVAEGIRRAADAGATVINLSLGEDVVLRQVYGEGLDEAVEYAWSKGSIPVLAAGNKAFVDTLFGTGYEDLPIVIVTATDNQDRKASYAPSVGGARWGIAAPGGDASGDEGHDILSAYPEERCALLAGTSMAAPHVSGALAVLRRTGLSPQQAIDRLLATAREVGSESTFGAGLVDLGAALGTPRSSTTPPPQTTVAPATTTPQTTAATTSDTTGGTVAPEPTPTTAPPATTAPSRTGGTTEGTAGADITGTSTTRASDDADASSSPSTSSDPDGDLATGVVVTDEGDGGPGALVVAVAAGTAALSAAGAFALWRVRGGSQP